MNSGGQGGGNVDDQGLPSTTSPDTDAPSSGGQSSTVSPTSGTEVPVESGSNQDMPSTSAVREIPKDAIIKVGMV